MAVSTSSLRALSKESPILWDPVDALVSDTGSFHQVTEEVPSIDFFRAELSVPGCRCFQDLLN